MFETSRQGAVTIVAADEPLTHENAEQAGRLFNECLSDGQPMAVIDLGRVPLLDSAGLELLLDVQEMFNQRGGALKVACPNPLCQDAIVITGVAEQVEVYNEVSEAVRSFLR